MIIPQKKGTIEKFVKGLVDQCMSSRMERVNRGVFFENYFTTGSADTSNAAMYNKVYASLDDLESLLYSPVSLRFKISDPDNPSVINGAKNRAAALKIRQYCRKSDTDTFFSDAVRVGLVKGKGLLKSQWKRGGFHTSLIQPEEFGVLRENHTALDEDMEAFNHRMLITPYQFARLIYDHPDRDELVRKAKKYTRESTGKMSDTSGSGMSITVGGLYPFQPAGVAPSGLHGIVDWMSQPKPSLAPEVSQSLMELNELWVWDDKKQGWSTFQLIGDDMLISGRYRQTNALAEDPATGKEAESLKDVHPFRDFCTNPVPGYFWGRSEISLLIALQEAINARIVGTNRLLRKQEDPPTKFIGSTGVNQVALSRYKKPGGYWTDTNPNAKIEQETTAIPQDLWASLHEYERMFDELMGLPPIARGKNEPGVRSAGHADTLVRQFSPRFKDRALLVERSVESVGALFLDLARVHESKKLVAWVPHGEAGAQGEPANDLDVAPAKNFESVAFTFGDLPEDVSLTVDSHSSSPAFLAEARGLDFDLLKAGAMSPADLLDHVDAADPEAMRMELVRRDIARAEAEHAKNEAKAASHGRKH